MKISILIPTCNRQPLLKIAIESCLQSDDKNELEILIGNDGKELTEVFFDHLKLPKNCQIIYFNHSKILGQAENINFLIEKASGEFITILHDDDYFISGGLHKLIAHIRHDQEQCIFGKQFIVNQEWEINSKGSDRLNTFYYRMPNYCGEQVDKLMCILRQMVPSDCFLLSASIAKSFKFKSKNEVGDYCDFEYLLQVALSEKKCSFFFIDEFISAYRVGHIQISGVKTSVSGKYLYMIAESAALERRYPEHYKYFFNRNLSKFMGAAYRLKDKDLAKSVYFKHQYPLLRRFSYRGIYESLICLRLFFYNSSV